MSVIVGGLYDLTHAAQGKGGSATDVMSPAKLEMSGKGELIVCLPVQCDT